MLLIALPIPLFPIFIYRGFHTAQSTCVFFIHSRYRIAPDRRIPTAVFLLTSPGLQLSQTIGIINAVLFIPLPPYPHFQQQAVHCAVKFILCVYLDFSQACTTIKGIVADLDNAFRNRHTGQACAAGKGISIDKLKPLWKGYARQIPTASESARTQ